MVAMARPRLRRPGLGVWWVEPGEWQSSRHEAWQKPYDWSQDEWQSSSHEAWQKPEDWGSGRKAETAPVTGGKLGLAKASAFLERRALKEEFEEVKVEEDETDRLVKSRSERNNKKRPKGSGTVSHARRARFQAAGMTRENEAMSKEDVRIDWDSLAKGSIDHDVVSPDYGTFCSGSSSLDKTAQEEAKENRFVEEQEEEEDVKLGNMGHGGSALERKRQSPGGRLEAKRDLRGMAWTKKKCGTSSGTTKGSAGGPEGGETG